MRRPPTVAQGRSPGCDEACGITGMREGDFDKSGTLT